MGKETWNWKMAATWLGTGKIEILFHFKYLNVQKRFHGKGNLELEDGSYLVGYWEHGVRHGDFKVLLDTYISEVLELSLKKIVS